MKTKILCTLFISIFFSACLIAFIIGSNRLQAVFLSFGTALQKDAVFAIQNVPTDNIFILKAEKEHYLTLYRRQSNKDIIRYDFEDNKMQISTTKNNQWIQERVYKLPYSPFSLLDEVLLLLKEKGQNAAILKAYTDSLLSAVSTGINDSSLLIDYDSLPTTIIELRKFFRNLHKNDSIDVKHNILKNDYFISTHLSPDEKSALVQILLMFIQDDYKLNAEPIFCSLTDALNQYSLYINTSALGQFLNLCISKNEQVVFNIEKLK